MSLVLLKLLGAGVLVPVLGASVTYPIISSLKSTVQKFKLDSLDDFKNNCWVSMIGGDQGEYSGQNKKLLVCPSGSNSAIAKFYLYNESSERSQELPKEVKEIKNDNSRDQRDITLTFKNQETEIIGVSNAYWKFLYNKNLNDICSIIWEDGVHRLSCKDRTTTSKLTRFNASPDSELDLGD